MNSRFFLSRQALVTLLAAPILLYSLNRPFFAQPEELSATRSPVEFHYSPQFFKFITFGFWPAAVDALWIRTLQLEGNSRQDIASFYELATDLDPYFYELYEQASVVFTYLSGSSQAHLDQAEHFLKKGIQVYETRNPPADFWSHPYTLYIFLAYQQAYEENDWPEAKRTFLKAAAIPKAPDYLLRMKNWLLQEGSEKILAKKVLKSLIQNTSDPLLKKEYEKKWLQVSKS